MYLKSARAAAARADSWARDAARAGDGVPARVHEGLTREETAAAVAVVTAAERYRR